MTKEHMNYELFETMVMEVLNKHAPIKEKFVRANNAPFMFRVLSKAITNRSRLRNKFLKNPNDTNKMAYKRHRNYCVNLLRREKKRYYGNLDFKLITDNKKFWKTMKPFFSEKNSAEKKIVLLNEGEIIFNDKSIAELMNTFFSQTIANLRIEGYQAESRVLSTNIIHNAIRKFGNHPRVLQIKENIICTEKFSFAVATEKEIRTLIKELNISKPTTFNTIPAKVILESCNIFAPYIATSYKNCILNGKFPSRLKLVEITPVYKQFERILKDNYRPVSILPIISKIFERNMYTQINTYMEKYFSSFLCGFRKGYSAQYCLIAMLEK